MKSLFILCPGFSAYMNALAKSSGGHLTREYVMRHVRHIRRPSLTKCVTDVTYLLRYVSSFFFNVCRMSVLDTFSVNFDHIMRNIQTL